ncbi:hypothetical protein P0F65_22200 [Sphingomonas sp. I4]
MRRSEASQRVLIAELQHRTSNLMGVVRSIADHTARGPTTWPVSWHISTTVWPPCRACRGCCRGSTIMTGCRSRI